MTPTPIIDDAEKQIDSAYDEGNKLCYRCHNKGDWTEFEERLDAIDIDTEPKRTLLTWLIVSSWAKSKIRNRDAFYAKCYERFADYPNRDEVLMGLK